MYKPEHYTFTGTDGITYATIDQVKRANEAAGQFFFSPGAMRFFSSRVGERTYCGPAGIFFVTSEKYENRYSGTSEPRGYTVRRFVPEDGSIAEASEFQEYTSAAQAARAAVKFAAGILKAK